MDKDKPKVFPTMEQIAAANAAAEAKTAQEQKENFIVSEAEKRAIEQLELEAKMQIEAHKRGEKIIRPELAENSEKKLRAVGVSYDNQTSESKKPIIERPTVENKPIKPITDIQNKTYEKPTNVPYDVIPLPSEGKIYPHKKSAIKVAYLNASDENILTSPNILENGEFLNILLNRKILEEGIELKDLHVGDRNAIMIWLRATGYGEMYPIVVYDKNGIPFETELDLSTLKYKKLGAEPDKNGLFDFKLPKSGKNIKFRLLTVGDIEEIEKLVAYEIDELELPYANIVTHRLERMIVEIEGVTDKSIIKDFISIMPAADSRALRNYYEEIESNVDLRIKVEVPGGDLIETFLPININFFWPDLGV